MASQVVQDSFSIHSRIVEVIDSFKAKYIFRLSIFLADMLAQTVQRPIRLRTANCKTYQIHQLFPEAI